MFWYYPDPATKVGGFGISRASVGFGKIETHEISSK